MSAGEVGACFVFEFVLVLVLVPVPVPVPALVVLGLEEPRLVR